MPMMGGIPGDLRDTLNKCLFLVGAFIPAIIFMIFPQLVLLAIGIFIVYMAYSRRNIY